MKGLPSSSLHGKDRACVCGARPALVAVSVRAIRMSTREGTANALVLDRIEPPRLVFLSFLLLFLACTVMHSAVCLAGAAAEHALCLAAVPPTTRVLLLAPWGLAVRATTVLCCWPPASTRAVHRTESTLSNMQDRVLPSQHAKKKRGPHPKAHHTPAALRQSGTALAKPRRWSSWSNSTYRLQSSCVWCLCERAERATLGQRAPQSWIGPRHPHTTLAKRVRRTVWPRRKSPSPEGKRASA